MMGVMEWLIPQPHIKKKKKKNLLNAWIVDTKYKACNSGSGAVQCPGNWFSLVCPDNFQLTYRTTQDKPTLLKWLLFHFAGYSADDR